MYVVYSRIQSPLTAMIGWQRVLQLLRLILLGFKRAGKNAENNGPDVLCCESPTSCGSLMCQLHTHDSQDHDRLEIGEVSRSAMTTRGAD